MFIHCPLPPGKVLVITEGKTRVESGRSHIFSRKSEIQMRLDGGHQCFFFFFFLFAFLGYSFSTISKVIGQ